MTHTIEPPELAAVRPGEELDWASLEAYLLQQIPELAGPLEVLQFPSGSANLTYRLRFRDTELVLRRPPFGVVAPGAHDMRREYRVLSRLWRNFDRAPRAYVFCDDHDVIGADFVVMERRRGEVVRGVIPQSMARHPDVARRISFALVDAMADLHLLDPEANDLGDLGKPAGFAARQVSGWKTRWDLVRPEDGPPLMDSVPERLSASVPEPTRVSIVHNDLKLDNCQFDPTDPDRVQSIFDWDMTTLGEPLVDLGTLLNYWPDPSDPSDARRVSHEGMLAMALPTRAEITARYAERTGIDVSSAGWYEAFAQWKTGVVIQQLHNRWKRGESTDPRMAVIADRLPVLAANANRLLDELDL
jgi:aminoglycoside phosphotransferase (APT) family kinase protein